MRKKGHHTLCYLDDFVGVAKSYETAYKAYNDLLAVTAELGLELSPAKCVPPSTDVEWLGFSVSTTNMTIKILHDRLQNVILWKDKKLASRRDIQRLVGQLQHVAKCIRPARHFISHILAALRAAPLKGKHLLPDELALDVSWFVDYATHSKGTVLLQQAPRMVWTIECDSSLQGGGTYSHTHFFAVCYSQAVISKGYTIAQLEVINLVVALKALHLPNPENYTIWINTDNMASQQVLTSGAGRDPVICTCAHEVWLFVAQHSTDVIVHHKPGKDISFADTLNSLLTKLLRLLR